MASRERLVYIAKLAEKSGRHDDVVEAMKNVVKLSPELTVEERNLLSLGYKNALGSRRASWRILSLTEQTEEAKGNEQQVKRIRDFRQRVESDISRLCNDALTIVDEHILPSSSGAESSVFYHKLKGDYYRYLAEFKIGDERREAASQSLQAYQTATTTAEEDLLPADPIRMGLALNFSVFHYEIMNSPERARLLAKLTFDQGFSGLETLNKESNSDSKLILQLLRDNYELWTSEHSDNGGDNRERTVKINGIQAA
uniref:14-3-3 domain-containing protein n=1 Tax=Ananas comosus var. bracteatus TaxID=296719 RepID=A0A6V7QH27_ANACO|nr:unnamed protein product [Ananas comosus var. bracteatus]